MYTGRMPGMRAGRVALGAAIVTWAALAQPSAPPAFDVVSIKPSDPTKGMLGWLVYPGGRVRIGHASLANLIEDALEVQPYQVLGGPAWANADKYQYDIDARVPASSESSKWNPPYPASPMNAEQRQMLLTMLADRFQLKFHRETRQLPVYLLKKDSKKPGLEAPKDSNAFPWVGSATDGGMMLNTGIRGSNASMALLAERLEWYFERPVVDETAIKGSFDFKFEITPDGPTVTSARLARSPEVLSSIVTSLRGIGLQLKTSRGPVAMVVIDHAEKPSEN